LQQRQDDILLAHHRSRACARRVRLAHHAYVIGVTLAFSFRRTRADSNDAIDHQSSEHASNGVRSNDAATSSVFERLNDTPESNQAAVQDSFCNQPPCSVVPCDHCKRRRKIAAWPARKYFLF
jgi:hypothetical protein